MKTSGYIVIIVILLGLTPFASNAQMFDSIAVSLKHKPKFDFRMDLRNSFITTQLAKISGIKAGLNWNNTVQAGIGYNWLISDIEKPVSGNEKTIKKLRFGYLSPYFEYTYYRDKKWEISIPVLFGFGVARYEYSNPINGFYKSPGKTVILYEPYMTGQYKLIPWVAIGFGVGYRLVLIGNRSLQENFNSPIYILKLKILLGEIYNSLKKE